MLRATKIQRQEGKPLDTVTLAYDDRFRRRIKLVCDGGLEVLLDLEKTTELKEGDDLLLENGSHISVRAANEPLMSVFGSSQHHLLRLTWHVGNRHLPCEVHEDHLLLRQDHVIEHMLEHLGAQVKHVVAPFNPEGGAYGQGRTHSHEH